jgi:hypothetical protein
MDSFFDASIALETQSRPQVKRSLVPMCWSVVGNWKIWKGWPKNLIGRQLANCKLTFRSLV